MAALPGTSSSPTSSGAFSISRLRVSTTILRGLRGLPVMLAGQAAVQRPHSVQL